MGATFPVIWQSVTPIARAYNVDAIPHNVVIGRDGRIAAVLVGFDEEMLETAVERAVGA